MNFKEDREKIYSACEKISKGFDKDSIIKEFFVEENIKDLSVLDKVLNIVKESVGYKEVIKGLEEEKRMALFVVMSPDDVDAHGDVTSEQEIERACNNFNLHCSKANLYHMVETEKAKIVQSFVTPSSFYIADSDIAVKKGAWLQWWYFPEGDEVSQDLWEKVKSGQINGVSIKARAKTTEI